MHFVEQARVEELAGDVRATTDPDVLRPRGLPRQVQRGVDPVGDEDL
jgi:hypothetical protein